MRAGPACRWIGRRDELRRDFSCCAECRVVKDGGILRNRAALVEMKNPRPVAFVSQANISSGPQQVNNATPPACTSSRAGNFSNPSNELLEVKNEERLDIGATGSTGKPYSHVETVGASHGTKE